VDYFRDQGQSFAFSLPKNKYLTRLFPVIGGRYLGSEHHEEYYGGQRYLLILHSDNAGSLQGVCSTSFETFGGWAFCSDVLSTTLHVTDSSTVDSWGFCA